MFYIEIHENPMLYTLYHICMAYYNLCIVELYKSYGFVDQMYVKTHLYMYFIAWVLSN